MSYKFYIGTDVGLKGALVCLDHAGAVVKTARMPTTTKDGSPAIKEKVCGAGLCDAITNMTPSPWETFVFVEDPGLVPMNGSVRIASLFHSLGAVEGALGAMGLKYELIKAQRWKKHYSLPGGQKQKRRSIEIAGQLNPELGNLKVKEADIAEACLIARYGCKYILGVL